MQIKFWGVRGSIPTPSTADFVTSRYGGNTTCVSLRIPGMLVIFDAGSGLRNLGLQLAREKPLQATFFFSHVHWDHIQGFPFFIPAFNADNSFDLHGPSVLQKAAEKSQTASGAYTRTGSALYAALHLQQRGLNFPVQLQDMPARMKFKDVDAGESITLEGTESSLVITPRTLNHPGGCFGYRVEEHKAGGVKTFVFATDTEHFTEPNPNVQLLAQDANVLFYDAQYTEDEYYGLDGISRAGWGHSTALHGVKEARAAGVEHLLLTHHDPLHDDWAVARIEYDARREGLKTDLLVTAAYEGLELEL